MNNISISQLFFIIAFPFLCIESIIAQNFNRPTPPSIYSYEFDIINPSFHGYYFTSAFHLTYQPDNPEYKASKPMLLDEAGYIVLYFPIEDSRNFDFKYFPEQQLYGFYGIKNNVITYEIFDLNFNNVDSFVNSSGVLGDGHDLLINENGNYVIGGAKFETVDLSGNIIDGIPASETTMIKGYIIEEFDTDFNLVFQWNSNDYIDPLDAYDQYGYDPDNYDYAHGNAIEEDSDGNYLISLRHTNAVYKINRDTGTIMWTLGGKSSDFTFPDDGGFSGQHDIRRLPNGNITLFDNGNSSTNQITRAVEYKLDITSWTASLIWEYIDPTPFFARAMGNHQTTTERNHLINYGFINRPYPSFSLVDDNKNAISNIYFEDNVMAYRSYVFDAPITIQRPEVSCNQLINSITLSAPAGYNSYVWSNGDETRMTTITESGEYQVWVDQGDVMVGSAPIIITDIATACEALSIEEYELEPVEKKVIAMYDMLGRKIKNTKANQLYIIRYDDRSTKKIIYTE